MTSEAEFKKWYSDQPFSGRTFEACWQASRSAALENSAHLADRMITATNCHQIAEAIRSLSGVAQEEKP